ncbi:hypothetical protein D3C80_443750 [compost metagenome]
MADFDRNVFDRRGNDAEDGEIHRVAIARNDLGGDRLRLQAQGCCDMFLDARVDVGEGADGAGDGAGGDLFAGFEKACLVAVHFGVEAGKGQAHRRRFGMDAVAAADADRILVFEGASLESSQNTIYVCKQNVGGAHELDVERRVEHVRRCHALVDEAAIRADEFRQMSKEGDDVMLGDGFDLIDAGDIEFGLAALFPDRFCRRFRNDADCRERVAGVGLDFEPDAKLCFRRPDGDHFRSGITGDHGQLACLDRIAAALSRRTAKLNLFGALPRV